MTRWQQINFAGGANLVDAAIATPVNAADVSNTFICPQIGAGDAAVGLLFAGSSAATIINPIANVAAALNIGLTRPTVPPARGMNVHKCGRTTEYTMGTIDDVDASVNVNYGTAGTALFTNQIVTGDMSDGGDSGSLVLQGGTGGIPPGDGTTDCQVLTTYGHILGEDQTQPIKTIRTFRDMDVKKSPVGKHYADLFKQNEQQITRIMAGGDPEVKSVLQEKGPAVLGAIVDAIESLNTESPETFPGKDLRKMGHDILDVFARKGDSDLKKAIATVRKEEAKYKGKNIREILDDLGQREIHEPPNKGKSRPPNKKK